MADKMIFKDGRVQDASLSDIMEDIDSGATFGFKFRNIPLYRGEYFVALTIPATEERDVIPVDAKVNPNGSYRFVFNTLYSAKDIDFAVQHGRRIIAEHPTWEAALYRSPMAGEGGSIYMAVIQ